MTSTRWLLYLIVLISMEASAQPKKPGCDCSILFKESVDKISTIYAGFYDKVTVQTQDQYDKLVNRLDMKAKTSTSERGCYETIKEYTDWFKDRHVGIWYSVKSSPAELRRIDPSEASKMVKGKLHGFEGIWTTADQKNQLAVIKDPSGVNAFIAVTISSSDSAWKPGMVKAEIYGYDPSSKLYRGMFYQADFNGMLDGFTLQEDRLNHWFGPSWIRQSETGKPVKNSTESVESVQFKKLNNDFVYLKLGRFNQQDVNKFDSIVASNRSVIYQSRNLIIDLRGNPGGDAGSSQEMIQLIYTNPVIYPAWQYRSSPELIASKKAYISQLEKADPYKMLKGQQQLVQRLENNPGKMVNGNDSIVRTVDSVARYPQRVAVLIDGGAGSSAEFFTFESKQSKKVTLFGANTAGVMDYGEDQSLNLSCGQYIIAVPWGRNGWIERFGFRIDNIGFKPDVRIPQAEKDWVGFVVKYWSR